MRINLNFILAVYAQQSQQYLLACIATCASSMHPTESSRLEEINKSSGQPSTTIITPKSCPDASWTLPDMGIPVPPWVACSGAWPLLQGKVLLLIYCSLTPFVLFQNRKTPPVFLSGRQVIPADAGQVDLYAWNRPGCGTTELLGLHPPSLPTGIWWKTHPHGHSWHCPCSSLTKYTGESAGNVRRLRSGDSDTRSHGQPPVHEWEINSEAQKSENRDVTGEGFALKSN